MNNRRDAQSSPVRWWQFHSLSVRRTARVRRLRHGALEALETRVLLSSTAGPGWTHPDQLTLSFVPDGALVAGYSNSLSSVLGAAGSTADWQGAVARAFHTLSSVTNVSVGIVSDDGSALGTPGLLQGDLRFGDIRIAAAPLSSDVYAISVLADGTAAGTWAGDLIFNSNYQWTSLEDIYSVALHEGGHILGLPGSDDPQSIVFPQWAAGTLLHPAEADIAALQDLYGIRDLDPNEAGSGNNTIDVATLVGRPGNYRGYVPQIAWGDLSGAPDVDWFQVRPLKRYDGPVDIELRTDGISLLRGRVSVYDFYHNLIDSVSVDDVDGRLIVHLPSLKSKVFVKIDSTTTELAGTGTYALTVSFLESQKVAEADVDRVARGRFTTLSPNEIRSLLNGATPSGDHDFDEDDDYDFGETGDDDDDDDGDSEDLPVQALNPVSGDAAGIRLSATGSLSDPGRAAVYRVESPGGDLSTGILTATVRTLQSHSFQPSLTVFDELGNRIPAEIIANNQGVLTIQLHGVQAGQALFLHVSAQPLGLASGGEFRLDVDFGRKAVDSTDFASGTLDSSATPPAIQIDINQAGLYLFGLQTTGWASAEEAVELIISNDLGQIVYQLVSSPGQTRTGDPILLNSGSYLVQVERITVGASIPSASQFRVFGQELSDPVGPIATSPVGTPAGAGYGGQRYTWGTTISIRPPATSSGNPVIVPPPNQPPTVNTAAYWQWYWYWFGGLVVN